MFCWQTRCSVPGWVWAVVLFLPAAGFSSEPSFSFYAERPYYEQPVPFQEVPEGLPDLLAETCGFCHSEIYEEWLGSTHAAAWRDLQFQAEIAKNPSVQWLCLNCHTPLLNQQPSYVVGLEDDQIDRPRFRANESFDPAFRDEAISCSTCHVRDGVILGPYGDDSAPHPVRKDPSLLEAKTCTRCHQARRTYKTQNLACMFRTGEEWEASPQAAEGQVCQSCHMPEVVRPVAEGGSPRRGRHHFFMGSRIPKEAGQKASAVSPVVSEFPEGLSVQTESVRCDPGENGLEVLLEIVNSGAGHKLPTGDPERFITLDLRIISAEGALLGHHQEWIGSRYEWWPVTRLLLDNRLLPREQRTLRIPVASERLPPGARLEIEATKHRMSVEAATYHDLAEYPIHRMFFKASVELAGRDRCGDAVTSRKQR